MNALLRKPRHIATWFAVAVAAACSGSESASKSIEPPPPPPVIKPSVVAVTFDSTYIRAGSIVQATAIPLDTAGSPMTGRGAPVWSIEGVGGIATISQSGTITTLAAGVVVIVATIDGVRGEDALVVRPPPALAQVLVTLDSSSILVGESTKARATLVDSTGEEVTQRSVVWSLRGTPGVATISSEGVVTAISPGSVTVVATVDGIEGEAPLQVIVISVAPVVRVLVTVDAPVIQVGGSTQARFQALDAAGNLLSGKEVTWSMGAGSAAATVSSSGVVTAVAVGTPRVVATVDQVVGSVQLTVSDSTTNVGQVLLPLPLRDSIIVRYPTVRGRTWNVRAGDNLQGALNSAQRGDEIVIQAGAVFPGSFTLPAKPGTAADGWILVRSDQAAALPPAGTRVGPVNAPLMPQLATQNAGAVLQTASGASGWYLTGLELTVVPTYSSINYGLVLLGEGTAKQNSLALVPSDIVLDRVYIHAHPTVGTSRCVALNSARTAIINSWLDECHLKGFDSQAIAGWNGPGPFRIENNALYGAGENVMFGGSDPAIPGLIPSDVILRRNHVYTPESWKGIWTKKNLLETKNVQRFLIEENVFDGSWGDAQVGYAFVLKSANQSGRCNWCASRDITFRSNLIRNVGAGFNLTGKEGSNLNPVGELMTRVLIENNIMENIAVPPFNGDGRIVQLLQNLSQLTIRDNSFTTSSTTLGQFLNIGSAPAATGFSFMRNIVTRGRYGLFSSASAEGGKALNNIRAPVIFSDVVVISSLTRTNYPVGTIFVPSWADAVRIPGRGADETRVRAIEKVVVVP